MVRAAGEAPSGGASGEKENGASLVMRSEEDLLGEF